MDNFFGYIFDLCYNIQIMSEQTESIKNKKVLFFTAMIVAVLIVAILIIVIISKKEKPAAFIATPTVSIMPKEKTAEEVINDLTAPAEEGKNISSDSEEIINSLSAPVDTPSNLENNKNTQSAPAPVSEDIIDSLSAPVK